jgi:hypothetical protein
LGRQEEPAEIGSDDFDPAPPQQENVSGGAVPHV